jgi:hypothetical protein
MRFKTIIAAAAATALALAGCSVDRSAEWLGAEGNPGNVAANLQSASQFLADQKQILTAPSLQTFQDAIYTKGLPGAIAQ